MNFHRTLVSASNLLKLRSSRLWYSSKASSSPPQASMTSTSLMSLNRPKVSPEYDPSTLSNYSSFKLINTRLCFKVDWANQKVIGQVKYDLESADVDKIVLDTSYLDVQSAEVDGSKVDFSLDSSKRTSLGSPLTIGVALTAGKHTLKLEFATTSECTALQWLTPEQTSGKKIPYMFSQCQAIHARSLFPCFDTPAVKSEISYFIESAHPAVVSGVSKKLDVVQEVEDFFGKDSSNKLYTFYQKVPIPSYLVAIASGDLAAEPIGPRSEVFCEPENLPACKYEFEHDTESFIKTAEKIVFPYEWLTYNVLVLPPAFPYGGMENPNITFATPSLISGDRQNVDVITHELAHSWSGNLVTNCSWEHFWLNEGWTVYLERRILGALHGEPARHLSAIIGWTAFEEAVEQLPEEFTKLVVDLKKGVDPDDAFSTIPYEKGFNFLYHLETALGGFKEFDPFIPYYFNKFKYKSLDSYQFKDAVYEFFSHKKDVLDSVDWDSWYFAPGLPAKPKFDTTLADQCYALVESWVSANANDLSKFSKGDISEWNTTQQQVFLDALTEKINTTKAPVGDVVIALDAAYDFSASNNAEVTFRWYVLELKAKQKNHLQQIADWLGKFGRMKYVRPVFRLLNEVDRPLALDTFKRFENFYHPICRSILKKDLSLN